VEKENSSIQIMNHFDKVAVKYIINVSICTFWLDPKSTKKVKASGNSSVFLTNFNFSCYPSPGKVQAMRKGSLRYQQKNPFARAVVQG